MSKRIFQLLVLICAGVLSACGGGGDPGPLAGTWKISGPMPMRVQFRRGETEASGVTEKVSYTVDGADVVVTYKDGQSKGLSIRYRMVNANTAKSDVGVLHRILPPPAAK